MNIGLIDVDGKMPNLALMKISAWHKKQGDSVEWYNGLCKYDKVYMSKVFTFTEDYGYYIKADIVEKGGTGYDFLKELPEDVDRTFPDYGLYGVDEDLAYGFLTRGCPNRCKWCIVPRKEGNIRPYMDIEEITGSRKKAILMDNNVLACDYGIQQIEKIVKMKIKVDFNQALDARLVNDETASVLARVKWIDRIRFGCDTPAQVEECEKAVNLIRKYGYKGEFFLFCILMDFKESFERTNYWKLKGDPKIMPFCQPFRHLDNKHHVIPQWQKDMARWANKKELFKSIEFKDYQPRKGFLCKEYFLQ